jgi:hypothetical protein
MPKTIPLVRVPAFAKKVEEQGILWLKTLDMVITI